MSLVDYGVYLFTKGVLRPFVARHLKIHRVMRLCTDNCRNFALNRRSLHISYKIGNKNFSLLVYEVTQMYAMKKRAAPVQACTYHLPKQLLVIPALLRPDEHFIV